MSIKELRQEIIRVKTKLIYAQGTEQANLTRALVALQDSLIYRLAILETINEQYSLAE